MDVKVYNCYFLDNVSVSRFGISRCHSYIVYEAKSIWIRLFIAFVISMVSLSKNSSMMTWWSGSTKSISKFTSNNSVYGFDCGSTCEKRCFPRFFWNSWVTSISVTENFILSILKAHYLFPKFFYIRVLVYLQNISYWCFLWSLSYIKVFSWCEFFWSG